MFPKLNLPEYPLKIKKTEKGISVFDTIRKKYILLTPEEYVRQQFVHYLIQEKNYPKGLLGLEKQLKIFDLSKRTDIVLYNKQGNVSVIVPDGIEKTYVIQNATTGAFTVTVKTTSGTGPTFSATDKTNKLVYSDGTDIIEYSDNLSNVASNGFAVAMAIAL